MTTQTSITNDDLNNFARTYAALIRLGRETAELDETGTYPQWNAVVEEAKDKLALIMAFFSVGRLEATEPWVWPMHEPPPTSLLFFKQVLGGEPNGQ